MEGTRTLSCYGLQRAGYLHPGHFGCWGWRDDEGEVTFLIQTEVRGSQERRLLVLTYNTIWDGVTRDYVNYIYLTDGPTNFGGRRDYFRCPRCGSRRSKLHRPPGSYGFACRVCHDLTYASCRESQKPSALVRLMLADYGMTMKDFRREMCRDA